MINLSDILADAARRLDVELSGSSDRIEEIALHLTSQLITTIGEPGYFEALAAARDILMLEVGLLAVHRGDEVDRELRAIVYGFFAGVVKAL